MSLVSEVPSDILARIRKRFGKAPVRGDWFFLVLRKTPGTPNHFDDILMLCEIVERPGGDNVHVHKASWATCDPGTVYYDEPMNPSGTAFMQEQYVKGAYRRGTHRPNTKTARRAFRQARPLLFRRLRPDGTWTAPFQDIIHAAVHGPPKSDKTYTRVNRLSAACIVVPSWATMEEICDIADESPAKSFDLILMEDVLT